MHEFSIDDITALGLDPDTGLYGFTVVLPEGNTGQVVRNAAKLEGLDDDHQRTSIASALNEMVETVGIDEVLEEFAFDDPVKV